jgi:UDP-N-acetylmuramate dehydrogenase
MIDADSRHCLSALLGDRVEFDAALSRHTSLRIGGPADALVTPKDREELAQVLAICHARALSTTVLGAGFNVLIREGGIRGVVLRLKKLRAIERVAANAILVETGASHATITRYCVEHALTGLEFAAGIPGTLGGWLAMNAGIGVRELKDVVLEIEMLDVTGSEFSVLPRADLDFRYRSLAGLPPGAILTRARLSIEVGERVEVQSQIDRLLAHRQATQPIEIPSCGSVFRNPPDAFAGQLIEAAGLKGLREGGAEISKVHANFIVNRGGATASEVMRLIEQARAAVEASAGVRLEPEVRILGEKEGHQA